MSLTKPLLCFFVLLLCSTTLLGREWSDSTGRLKLEAEFFAASSDTVVIKRRDGSLVGLKIDELSAADLAFVNEKKQQLEAAKGTEATDASAFQTWTSVDGFEIRGKVIAFGRREVSVQRIAGLVTVNGTAMSRLNLFYQYIVPKVVAKFADPTVKTAQDVDRWLRSLRTPPPTFTVEGVLMKLEDGSELAVPFFLLSERDLAILNPGWEKWKQEDSSERDRQQESFLMSVQADSYQRQKDADATSHQIQMMQLGLMAVNAGLISIWEVQLQPRPGVYARPTWVMVPAPNSLDAEQQVLQNYPGFTVVGVRRASR